MTTAATGSTPALRTDSPVSTREAPVVRMSSTGRSQHLREAATQLDPISGMLENQELFQVASGMAARLQEEVAVQERAGIGEQGLNRRAAQTRIGHS